MPPTSTYTTKTLLNWRSAVESKPKFKYETISKRIIAEMSDLETKQQTKKEKRVMILLKVDIMFFRFSAFKTHLSTYLSIWVVLIFFRSFQALSLTSLLSSIFLSPSLSLSLSLSLHLSLPFLSSVLFHSLSFNLSSHLSFSISLL